MREVRIAVGGLHRGENPQPGSSVVESIREAYPEAFIVGLAYGAYESGIFASAGPDIVYTIPYPTAGFGAFFSRMSEIQAETPVDWIIPTLDAEISMLSGSEGKLGEIGVSVDLPPPEVLRMCSKANLPELAARIGVKTPRTEVSKNVLEAGKNAAALGYPVFLKGPYYDASFVRTQEELFEEGSRISEEWGSPLIVQKPVMGSEFNVMGIGDGAGGVLGFCSVKKLIVSSKGKGNGSVVVKDPSLEEIASRTMSATKWHGPFELELIKEAESAEYHLVEINPRFPAWAGFPTKLGANFPAAWLDWLLSRPLRALPQISPGNFFLRHQIEVTGDMGNVASLMSSGVSLKI